MKKIHGKALLKLLFLCFLIAGTVYVIAKEHSLPFQSDSGKVFGTMYHITYQSDKPLSKEINAALQDIDNSLSIFNKESVVSRINRNEDVDIDQHFETVFTLAMQVAEQTKGAFDPTVTPLVNMWGFGFDSTQEADKHSIDSVLQFVGYEKISLKRHKIKKTDSRVMLDFGAIAKGYACDIVAKVLKAHDVRNYMVEIGGEVVCQGLNKEGKKWRVGITKPDDNDASELQEVIAVNSCAMATSGNYRNYYYRDGKKYAHTINAKTGLPVSHSLLSATVIAPTCAMADAYATAFMVLGEQKAQEILAANSQLAAYLIFVDGEGKYKVWYSKRFEKLLGND